MNDGNRPAADGTAGGKSRIVALGAHRLLQGFTLAGVELVRAETAPEVRESFAALDARVAVVILTIAAHRAAADLLPDRPEVLWTVLPY